MKKVFLSLIVLFTYHLSGAQVVYDYLKAADQYYQNGDYYSAAEYYEKYLGKGKSKDNSTPYNPYNAQKYAGGKTKGAMSSKEQATYNLAECYRQLHFPAKAEPYYVQAVGFDKTQFPLARYQYATTLRSLGKYSEAEAAYKTFINEYPNSDKYKEDAIREAANLNYLQDQLKKNTRLYTVTKAGGEVPDSGATYAPVLYNDMLYFTSTKADNSVHKLQMHNNRVYQAAYSEGNLTGVSKTAIPELKDVQQGVISISDDGNTIYLTRWTVSKGKKISSIYVSKKSGNTWSEPTALPATINVPGFSSQEAFIMPDGKQLVFTSNQPGSYGGFDLWTVQLDAANNVVSAPVNLGTLVNTANDERAPYYHLASKSLVFSSNGRVGMGGFDFFYSKNNNGKWSEPKNFGHPMNSVKDDIYFTSKGKANNILGDVVFSSDRDAACCLELFTLKKKHISKEISGQVVNCDGKTPVEGATVKIQDTINNTTVTSLVTGKDGRYSFILEEFQPLQAIASANGFYSASQQFEGPSVDTANTLTNPELCLTPIVIEKPIVVNNVYYDFNKADLRPESATELDKLVAMLEANPNAQIEVSSHTDSKGSEKLNKRLSNARAESVVKYLESKGIDRSKIIAKGYAATQPIAPNTNEDGTDNPEGRQQNRRTEFKVLKN